MRKIAIIVIIVVFLGAFGVAVAKKENQLTNGTAVILKIAPVDPRSLMQGDYMQLDFSLAGDIERALDNHSSYHTITRRGAAIINLDENNVGRFVRLDDGTPLTAGELRLRYKIREGRIQLASGAFFFQEGQAELYDRAEYGELRLDSHGNPLITNLLNNDFMPIKAAIYKTSDNPPGRN